MDFSIGLFHMNGNDGVKLIRSMEQKCLFNGFCGINSYNAR